MDDLHDYYSTGAERGRLSGSGGDLELVRTMELLDREMPKPPSLVLDIGGGPGLYASLLAGRGYTVHLVDVVPLHVEQARERASAHPDSPFTAEVGDARNLSAIADSSFDAVLLLGPLYHLVERCDRIRALGEARRVVRTGGLVAVAAISRYASLFDGVARGYLEDDRFRAIVERDLRDGQHRNPTDIEAWFTTAYFHLPEDLGGEVEQAGLEVDRIVGVEGPGSWFDLWPMERERVLQAARLGEDVPALSAHMLCFARA